MKGHPPLSPGDVVVSDYRVPPFYKDETLIVDEVKNIGTRGNPYWRAHLRSRRGAITATLRSKIPMVQLT